MNIQKLEKVLANYNISLSKVKNNNSPSMPFMLSLFHELTINEIPPTQNELIDEFKDRFPEHAKADGAIPRLKRSYLSFVREYHLGFLLRKHFSTVIYDEELDFAGVDFVVYYKRHKFNIHAFVDTESGRYWREIKNKRHNFEGRHLDIALNLRTGKRCGQFILYTNSNIAKLKVEMEKAINAK